MIKNFADLKRAIQAKTPFLIVEHYTRPEFSKKNPNSDRSPDQWILFYRKRQSGCKRNVVK